MSQLGECNILHICSRLGGWGVVRSWFRLGGLV